MSSRSCRSSGTWGATPLAKKRQRLLFRKATAVNRISASRYLSSAAPRSRSVICSIRCRLRAMHHGLYTHQVSIRGCIDLFRTTEKLRDNAAVRQRTRLCGGNEKALPILRRLPFLNGEDAAVHAWLSEFALHWSRPLPWYADTIRQLVSISRHRHQLRADRCHLHRVRSRRQRSKTPDGVPLSASTIYR